MYGKRLSHNTSTLPARQPRPLPVPETKWHIVSVDLASGLPPSTRGHVAIMTGVDRLWKFGVFIPCRKDMTANDLGYVFLHGVIRLKACPRQIHYDQDKLVKSKAWTELAQRCKIEMHQTLANRPQGNGLAERRPGQPPKGPFSAKMAWQYGATNRFSSVCEHTAFLATMCGTSSSCSPRYSSTT